MQAECYRQMEKYPDAVDTYHKMLVDFPGGAYRERACAHIFTIADYWLDDTRAEIQGRTSTVGRMTKLVKLDTITLGALSTVFEKQMQLLDRLVAIEPEENVITLKTKPAQ